MKEAPFDIYKSVDELSDDEVNEVMHRALCNFWTKLNSYNMDEARAEIKRLLEENQSRFLKIYRDDIKVMLDDVNSFVNSYNYSDCDGMIDYFNVNFYYFDCKPEDLKIVPKTARIKNKETAPAPKKEAEKEEAPALEENSKNEYKITQGEDTRDGSILWLVRIEKTLSKAEYIEENKKMRELGGYYSKFRHAFIFRENPTELLNSNKAA